MRARALLTVALGLLATAAQAQTVTTYTDRLVASTRVVIGSSTFGTGALRVVGLGARSGTTSPVWADAAGDFYTGAVLETDITDGSVLARLAANETVTGSWTFSGALAANAGITVDSTAFKVDDTTGNTSIAGTLGVTGNTTLTGDLAINGNDLTSTGALTVRPTGNLVLDPTGDVVFGPDGVDILPASNAVYNLGALSTKYLTLHAAELWVETLVAQNTMATIGGRILVGPTTTLTQDLAAAGAFVCVKHNEIANGDRVVLESSGKLEWLAVTSAVAADHADCGGANFKYTVTRNLDTSGANDWYAGDAVFNTGTTNDGFIDLYSVAGVLPGSTAGPTIVGNVRTGTTYSNLAPRWAIGNLNGLYGYSAATYGAAFGSYVSSSEGTNVTIDATNGVRFRVGDSERLSINGSGDVTLKWYDTSANLLGTIDAYGVRLATFGAVAGYSAFRWDRPAGSVLGMRGAASTSQLLYLTNESDSLPTASYIGAVSPYGSASITLDSSATTDRITIYSGDYVYVNNALVGLGVESPTVRLDVSGSTKISDNLTVDTNTLYVDATNNRVGIGTASPSETLDVRGAIRSTSTITALSTTSTDGYITMTAGTSANIGYLIFHASTCGTRKGYLGWGSANVNLYLENSAHFEVNGGAIQLPEMSEPSAPSANYGRLYVKDNGSGKSQACVRFASGASQCFATEP
jgi:hypothetical protein